MLKTQPILYSLRDISIIPAVSTSIKSRRECNPFRKSIEGVEGYYPLIASPMDSVLDDKNWIHYWNNKISCVVPRSIPQSYQDADELDGGYEAWFTERRRLCAKVFCAFSLKEAQWFLDNSYDGSDASFSEGLKIHVLIDIANGSMQEEIDLGSALKRKYGDGIVLMGGNIGNPQTYLLYDAAGFDYLRVGIGSGQGCLSGETKIILSDGTTKCIKDLCIGDVIKTITGNQKVQNIVQNTSDEQITINGNLTCTTNHKLFVVDKKNRDLVTSENILSLGYYIEAGDLNKEEHLLIRLEDDN